MSKGESKGSKGSSGGVSHWAIGAVLITAAIIGGGWVHGHGYTVPGNAAPAAVSTS